MLKSACEDFKVAVTVPSEVKENTLEMNKKARQKYFEEKYTVSPRKGHQQGLRAEQK